MQSYFGLLGLSGASGELSLLVPQGYPQARTPGPLGMEKKLSLRDQEVSSSGTCETFLTANVQLPHCLPEGQGTLRPMRQRCYPARPLVVRFSLLVMHLTSQCLWMNEVSLKGQRAFPDQVLDILGYSCAGILPVGDWALQSSGEGVWFLGQAISFEQGFLCTFLTSGVGLTSFYWRASCSIWWRNDSMWGDLLLLGWGSRNSGLWLPSSLGSVGQVYLRDALLLCCPFGDRVSHRSSLLISPLSALLMCCLALFSGFIPVFSREEQVETSLSPFVQTRTVSVFAVIS